MTSSYRRDHEPFPRNDEFDRLDAAARTIIINASAFFLGQADTADTPIPSEGEERALKRAMARYLIDSGIASARGVGVMDILFAVFAISAIGSGLFATWSACAAKRKLGSPNGA